MDELEASCLAEAVCSPPSLAPEGTVKHSQAAVGCCQAGNTPANCQPSTLESLSLECKVWRPGKKKVSEPLKMLINHHRLEEGCSNKGEDVWDVVINMQQPASWFGDCTGWCSLYIFLLISYPPSLVGNICFLLLQNWNSYKQLRYYSLTRNHICHHQVK